MVPARDTPTPIEATVALLDGDPVLPSIDATFRALLASSGDCIKLLDLDGRLIYMNDSGRRIMEVDDFDALRGRPWHDFWRGTGNQLARDAVEAARGGETAEYFGAADTAKGNPRYWHVKVRPVVSRDGTVTHILSVSRDISISKRAAETIDRMEVAAASAAKAEAEKLRRLFEDAPSFMCVLKGPEHIFEMTNTAYREVFGSHDVVGKPARVALGEMGERGCFEHLDTVYLTGAPHVGSGVQINLDDSAEVPARKIFVSFVSKPIFADDGTIEGILIEGRDVSTQKRNEIMLRARETDLRESEAKFRAIADTMPQMVWSTLPDGFHDYYNARWYEFTGVPVGSTDGENWKGLFHPEDQPRAWAKWRHSLLTGETYEIEYRLRHHTGVYRWTLGRALPIRDEDGRITRWFGTCTDIDDAKRDAEYTALLSHELSHRIKNIFAIVHGLIGLSARNFPEAKAFAEDLRLRIAALGRAHDFARPCGELSRPVSGKTTLHAVLREILKPYPALDEGRLTITGEDTGMDDRAATPIALVFHELATNASKYGALSVPGGRVTIACKCRDGECVIGWIEDGGPEVPGEPEKTGFGTRLSSVSMESHLGGRIVRKWHARGLEVEMVFPEASLRRI